MAHPRPYYYLENFFTALAWLQRRYGDLLNEPERAFIQHLTELRIESSALLVRMIGRRGDLFRTSKLQYEEIGCPRSAAQDLVELGWIDERPSLTLTELGRLLTKPELWRVFRATGAARAARKSELLLVTGCNPEEARAYSEWWPGAADNVYRVVVTDLCERLRILFFGNFRQQWSEFVLADLGIFKYESVAFDAGSRAFQTREQVDAFHALYRARERLEKEASADAVLESIPSALADNAWLEGKRARVLFQLAQRCEKQGDLARALDMYRNCQYPGARLRGIRMLERLERWHEAAEQAAQIAEGSADEIERQQLARVWPRLRRKLGLPTARVQRPNGWPVFELELPEPLEHVRVEQVTREALSLEEAPVHYVENGLINALFGLLCWEAIFAALPGAFFHEFQSAPADLLAPDFRSRREHLFAPCFAQLECGEHRHTILSNFERKNGIQSPFVPWGRLDESLLHLALACLPGAHLRLFFERILLDIRANRSGLPDLIQMWPGEQRYRLIEVKGPGDRLQSNQIRWLGYCVSHGIPVSVCHVRWAQAGGPAR